MRPACLLDAHPLTIILLHCALLGPLLPCRPKEAFLGASSAHKSDNLSALLTTQPQRETEGDMEIDRERPQRYQLCPDEERGCQARCHLKFEEVSEGKP